jgi:hypothetical protein
MAHWKSRLFIFARRPIARAALLVPAMLFLTTGCASVEVREGRRLDALLAAAHGEPPDKLARQLASHGYTCTATADAALNGQTAMQCARQRSNLWPPYSCIFRVDLPSEAQAGTTGASPAVSHACAGL